MRSGPWLTTLSSLAPKSDFVPATFAVTAIMPQAYCTGTVCLRLIVVYVVMMMVVMMMVMLVAMLTIEVLGTVYELGIIDLPGNAVNREGGYPTCDDINHIVRSDIDGSNAEQDVEGYHPAEELVVHLVSEDEHDGGHTYMRAGEGCNGALAALRPSDERGKETAAFLLVRNQSPTLSNWPLMASAIPILWK